MITRKSCTEPYASRAEDTGITLITVLLSLVILASFATMTQQITFARTKTMAAIISRHQEQLNRASLPAILAPQIGESLLLAQNEKTGPFQLNGAHQEIQIRGTEYSFFLQDVEALPDLFLSSPEVFDVLFAGFPSVNGAAIRSFREMSARSDVTSIEQGLQRLGVPREDIFVLSQLTTIRAKTSRVNVGTMPRELQPPSDDLERYLIDFSFPNRIALWIQ